jgi:hypothetical protein
MVGRHGRIRGGMTVIALFVAGTGALAQGLSTAERDYPPLLGKAPTDGEFGVRSRRDGAPAESQPANLIVPDGLRPLVRRMWESSPTFRMQCERIAGASSLIVRVLLVPQHAAFDASTHVSGRAGGLVAHVFVGRISESVELLAHELEHVIERLDGIDVGEVAARAPGEAWRSGRGLYETRRAIQVGRTVAAEVSDARNRAGA